MLFSMGLGYLLYLYVFLFVGSDHCGYGIDGIVWSLQFCLIGEKILWNKLI